MGAIGFYHGSIEEARLYDVALTQDQIGELRVNQPSSPAPIGWWTFEDGTASDLTGHFPAGLLAGGARIVDGQLQLNGTDAFLLIDRCRTEPQQMFYRPRDRATGRMWDTWLYFHEGTYYLYYLANCSASWDNISMATSHDGVHWTEHGVVLRKRPDAVWMGTGSTWKSPEFDKQARFFLNFSEWRGNQQTIFFAESPDLVHWQRLDDRYEFKPDSAVVQRQRRQQQSLGLHLHDPARIGWPVRLLDGHAAGRDRRPVRIRRDHGRNHVAGAAATSMCAMSTRGKWARLSGSAIATT